MLIPQQEINTLIPLTPFWHNHNFSISFYYSNHRFREPSKVVSTFGPDQSFSITTYEYTSATITLTNKPYKRG